MTFIPDFPRLPARYTFDEQRIDRVVVVIAQVELESRRRPRFATNDGDRSARASSSSSFTSELSSQEAIKAACALTLALHAGEEVFAFAVDAGEGLAHGVVDRRHDSIADLWESGRKVERVQGTEGTSGPRFEVVEEDQRRNRPCRTPLRLCIARSKGGSASTTGTSIELELEYDRLVLPHLEAEWILQHILHFYHQLLELEDFQTAKISDLAILPRSERDVFAEYSTSAPSLSFETYPPSITTLHGFFQYTANNDPNAPALQFDDLGLSYSQLLHAARYLAASAILPHLGSKRNPVVPICLDKSPEMIISMLAVLLSGATYLNLEPAWPEQRKKTILDELNEVGSLAEVAIVKTEDGEDEKWSTWGQEKGRRVIDPVEIVKELLGDVNAMEERFPIPLVNWPQVKQDDLAYVIYTSGTTGVPKGIAVEHRNVVAFLRNYRGVFGRAKGERVLQFPSYSFDVSVMNIWDTFAHGATLCMTSPSSLMSDLAGTILRLGCTLVDLTPTISALLFEHLESQPKEGENVREAWERAGFKIKQVNTGGEKVEAWIRDAWMDRGVRVVIDYGPTETTVGVIANQSRERSPPSVPIGRPVGATKIYILSPENLEMLPLGCIGEICVGGEQVTRGYIRTELNEGVFAEVVGLGRIYRSGDLGRFLGDGQGSIECLGRKDGQVKVNGLRIETGEIEEHLTPKAHRAIRRGVVDKLETDDVAPSLVAFLDLSAEDFPVQDDRSVDAELSVLSCASSSQFNELVEAAKKYLGGVVPAYMVPRYWLPVNRIPTQGMGKTDRKSLRSLAEQHDWRRARRGVIDPGERRSEPKKRTEDEWHASARKAWAGVLKMDEDDIGDEDAFTRLGGDSIGFLKVVGKLRQSGHRISFRELVDCATLTDCAAALKRVSNTEANGSETSNKAYVAFSLLPDSTSRQAVLDELASELALPSKDVDDVLPTAPSQDALLAASLDSTHYYAQAIYSLAEDVEIGAVCRALAKLVETHAVLRTCFAVLETTGATMQVVLKANSEQARQAVEVERIEVGEAEMDQKVDAWLESDRQAHVFKWGRLALSFAIFACARTSKRKLAWSMHHAMSDGWTLELLSTDLRCLVHSLQLESRPSFSAVVDWWSRAPSESAKIESFWKSYLAGAKPLNWPSQAPLNGEQLSTSSAATLHWHGDLKALSKRNGVTPAIASRVAIAIALGHFATREEVVLGIVRSGRDIEVVRAEDIIGPCVSVLPSRLELDRSCSLFNLAERETRADRQARANQHITLSALAKTCDLSARADLFDILVTYQSLAERDEEDEETSKLSWPIRQPPEKIRMPTSYTLSLEVTPQLDDDEALELACFYDHRVIGEDEVMGVLKATAKVLDYFVTAPCTKVGELRLEGEGRIEVSTIETNGVNGQASEVGGVDEDTLKPVMEKITSAWASVLRVDANEIGVSDSFGSLGGDSITMMRLSVRLTKAGVPIPVQALTKLATIREQARWWIQKQQ